MYALLCTDDLTSGTTDRTAAYCVGPDMAWAAGQIAKYPADIASHLRVCVWAGERGWVPAGSDE